MVFFGLAGYLRTLTGVIQMRFRNLDLLRYGLLLVPRAHKYKHLYGVLACRLALTLYGMGKDLGPFLRRMFLLLVPYIEQLS